MARKLTSLKCCTGRVWTYRGWGGGVSLLVIVFCMGGIFNFF